MQSGAQDQTSADRSIREVEGQACGLPRRVHFSWPPDAEVTDGAAAKRR